MTMVIFFCGFSQFSSLRVPLVATATSVISLAAHSDVGLPGLSWKLAVRTSFLSGKKKTHIVLQQRPKKGSSFRVGGSRITTFVCMTKINHWGVGVTKLRDDIVKSVCNSHTAPFS